MEPVNDPRVYSNRYHVTHLIARGGMATVYRAQDQLLNRAVALKILDPELSADPSFVERFRREAQSAANLSNPNIVPVFDWGEDNGTYFIVMELVEGASLAEELRRDTTVSPQRTAQLGAQMASALAYAHRQGMVHRDVKPGNILITPEGVVKVTDFGIAQAVASEDHLAEAGSVMGTATYFSPEQAEGRPVDGRSDTYSLGIVLYEMVAGRPPFTGATPIEVSSQHVNSTVPSLSDVAPSVPQDLAAIVMRALAKNPNSRYASADDLRSDLVRFTNGQPVFATTRGAGDITRAVGIVPGADQTQAVGVVSGGERTQAVPVFSGPRTNVQSRQRRRRRGPFLVALLLVALVAAGLGYAFVGTASQVTLPNLVNETVTAADATLRHEGLVPVPKLVASKLPTGTVVAMNPAAGTKVAAHSTVTLSISLGQTAAPVVVPSVVGLSVAVAESTLYTAGLGYTISWVSTTPTTTGTTATTTTSPSTSTTTATTTTTPPQPNTVLQQTPIGGTSVAKGTIVTLTVLAPTSTFPVPSLQGDTVAQAASALGQMGLTVAAKTTSTCSNHVPNGVVVRTVPAANAQVSSGTSVTLVLSSGYCQVIVPDVLNQPLTAANQLMASAGLVTAPATASPSVCTSALVGDVVAQSVSGGTFTLYNSTIVLSVCESAGATGSSGTSGTSGTTGSTGLNG